MVWLHPQPQPWPPCNLTLSCNFDRTFVRILGCAFGDTVARAPTLQGISAIMFGNSRQDQYSYLFELRMWWVGEAVRRHARIPKSRKRLQRWLRMSQNILFENSFKRVYNFRLSFVTTISLCTWAALTSPGRGKPRQAQLGTDRHSQAQLVTTALVLRLSGNPW